MTVQRCMERPLEAASGAVIACERMESTSWHPWLRGIYKEVYTTQSERHHNGKDSRCGGALMYGRRRS